MDALLDLPPGADLSSGISPALAPHDGAFWSDGENVHFREGGVQSMRGSAPAPKMEEQDAYALEQGTAGTGRRVFLGLEDSVKYFSSNHVYTIATGFTANDWSLQPFGTWLAFTNGVDPAKLWKAGAVVDLSVGGTVSIFKQLGPHLIALNVGGQATRVVWASADAPEDWDILNPANTAGDLFLRDFNNGIIAAQLCASGIAIYSKDQMGLLSYIGTPFIFGFENRINGIGAVGKQAVVAVGALNFGMSRAGIWRTDSVQFEYVDEPALQGYLQENVNWAAADRVAGFHDEASTQVIFSYPEGSSTENNRAVGFNYKNNTWTRYSFGFRAGIERAQFDYPLFSRDGGVRFFGSEDASDYPAWVQSKPLDFGDTNVGKRIQELNLGLRGSATLALAAQERLDSALDWYFSSPAAARISILEREAPFQILKLTGTAWKLSRLKVLGVVGGFAA